MLRSLIVWAGLIVLGLAALKVLVLLAEPRMAFFPFRGEDETPMRYGIRFEAITVNTADGERLRAWWIPAERPRAHVVYFHGNGGNLSMWTPVLVGLHRQRLSVLAVDYRGYGLSTGRPSERGLYRDVEATLACFDQSYRRPRVPTIYWGRSLGTAMASYAASKAFELVLAEGLWSELRARGVDVLACRAGATRTPGYAASRPRRSVPLMEPEDVARRALDALGHGPSVVTGALNRVAAFAFGRLLPRRASIQIMGRATRRLYG